MSNIEQSNQLKPKLLPCPFCGGGASFDGRFAECGNIDCPLADVFTPYEWNIRAAQPENEVTCPRCGRTCH